MLKELYKLIEAEGAKPSSRKKYYVGKKGLKMTVFLSAETPTPGSHGPYAAVIGPFRTKKGADFMAAHGLNNPHLQSVSDAERIANKK